MASIIHWPSWIPTVNAPGGQRPAGFVKMATSIGLPLFPSESAAEDMLGTGLQVEPYMNIRTKEIDNVFCLAGLVSTCALAMHQAPYVLANFRSRHDHLMVSPQELLELERVAGEGDVEIDQEFAGDMRTRAWDDMGAFSNGDRVIERVAASIVAFGRFEGMMSVVHSGNREVRENLVVRYRGTPRLLQERELDAVVSAFYEEDGIDMSEVEGPVPTRPGATAMLFTRAIRLGPHILPDVPSAPSDPPTDPT